MAERGCKIHGPLRRGRFADVGGKCFDGRLRLLLADGRCCRRQHLGIAVDQDEFGSFGSEQLRRRRTDALRGPGHERCLSRHTAGHAVFLTPA